MKSYGKMWCFVMGFGMTPAVKGSSREARAC